MAKNASRVAALKKRIVVLNAHVSRELGCSSHRKDARLVILYLVRLFLVSWYSSLKLVALLDGDAVKSFARARESVTWIERGSIEVDAEIYFEGTLIASCHKLKLL